MAPCSLRFVVTLCVFFNIDFVLSQDYEALVVIDNLPSRPSARLPYKAEEVNDQIMYPRTTEDGEKIEYSYLCPLQTPEIVHEVIKLSDKYPEYFYSLENNALSPQPSKCSSEVKPLIIEHRELRDLKCSKSSDQFPFNFAFNYIKMTNNPSTAIDEIVTLRLYDICFNNKDQMVWTRHRVATGLMLYGDGLPSQQIQAQYDYSTEPYTFLPQNLFENVASTYKKNAPFAAYKMVPQMMVPHEDLALKLWKKTALHYVNTSPLWKILIPLMKAINDGIRKAAIMVSVETYDPRTQQSDQLDIYTTTFSYSKRTPLSNIVKKYFVFHPKDFGLNVWCKFIHYESKKKGLMIYLHNMPKFPPIKIISTSSDSLSEITYENTECVTPVPCDIRNWSDEPELLDNLLNYAYCCPVNNKKVEELFGMTLDDELGFLDIDEFNKQPTLNLFK